MGRFLALVPLLVAACYSPAPTEGLACATDGLCPSGQTCNPDNVCVTTTGQFAPDASPGPDGDSPIDGAFAPPSCDPTTTTFDSTGSIATLDVPACVDEITIEAFGAEGGGGYTVDQIGGRGARLKGTFLVSGGLSLKILVGERGINAEDIGGNLDEQGGGTGGGGSFVATAADEPLLVAGGGGGYNNYSGVNGGDGQIGGDGQPGGGSNGAPGGSLGLGGTFLSNSGYHGGAGGAGFTGDGIGVTDGNVAEYGTGHTSGIAFVNGGAGGAGGSKGRSGGFGGGGASGFSGGGGGGYSGGGAGGYLAATHGGGGGGSYNAGTSPEAEGGVHTGNGQIVISW